MMSGNLHSAHVKRSLLFRSDLWKAVAVALFLLPGIAMAQTDSAHQFSVRDNIQMTRIIPWEQRQGITASREIALFSPSRRHFAVLSIRGNLAEDENIAEIRIWSSNAVMQAIALGERPSEGTLAIVRRYHDDVAQPSHLMWVNDATLTFSAADEQGVVQVFQLDVASHHVTQLTHSHTGVLGYSVSATGIVYFASVPAERPTTIVVNEESIFELLTASQPGASQRLAGLYFTNIETGQTRQLLAPRARLPSDDDVSTSPDGRWAIVLNRTIDTPRTWASYVTSASDKSYVVSQDRPLSSEEQDEHLEYMLVDVETGRDSRLIDAPYASLSFPRLPQKIFWSADGRTVVVSNVMAPLSMIGGSARGACVLAVDLPTRHASVVLSNGVLNSRASGSHGDLPRYVSLEWDPQLMVLSATRVAGSERSERQFIRARAGSWVDHEAPARPTLRVSVQQDLNTLPRLGASVNGRDVMELWNPNPQLTNISFGRAELVQLGDGRDRAQQGVLIYPPGYVAGRRYPLIVQTHGWLRDEFLVTGPSGATTAFAARALSAAGFLVLQVGEVGVTDDPNEAHNVADWYAAAVGTLVDRGLVQPGAVGIIGWSRTGYHVMAALAYHPDLFQAAAVSDSIQYNYSQFIYGANSSEAVSDIGRVAGTFPRPSEYDAWFARSPLYRSAAASQVPLRVESIGEPISMWETYAVFVLTGHPVEHVLYPFGSHNLQKPSEQLVSQGGNVDWFRFWLQGYEDPDRTKVEQYSRWRAFRVSRPTSARVH